MTDDRGAKQTFAERHSQAELGGVRESICRAGGLIPPEIPAKDPVEARASNAQKVRGDQPRGSWFRAFSLAVCRFVA
jgi:hypothetical protein